jgi:hypothetical protein
MPDVWAKNPFWTCRRCLLLIAGLCKHGDDNFSSREFLYGPLRNDPERWKNIISCLVDWSIGWLISYCNNFEIRSPKRSYSAGFAEAVSKVYELRLKVHGALFPLCALMAWNTWETFYLLHKKDFTTAGQTSMSALLILSASSIWRTQETSVLSPLHNLFRSVRFSDYCPYF